MANQRQKHKTDKQKGGSSTGSTRNTELRQIFQVKQTKFKNPNWQDTNHWPVSVWMDIQLWTSRLPAL